MAKELTLSASESKQLEADKTTVRKGMATFVEVGKALMRIRDAKLYRVTHKTFAKFCEAEFQLEPRRAYQLIESAGAAENVQNFTQNSPPETPTPNESQARVLASVDPEQQPEVWEAVVNTAPINAAGTPVITARHVQSVVDEFTEEEPDIEEEPTLAEICEGENKAIESFCRSLVKFYEENVPRTAWSDESGRIESALSNVRAACSTLRSAKATLCPACEEGQTSKGKCRYCKGNGYLPAHQEKTVPQEMRL